MPNKNNKPTEHEEQCSLFYQASLQENIYPELALLHAIPNGGQRHKAVAAKMKREGAKRGVPDICLPVSRSQYHGLYIEMKVKPNKTTKNQRLWLQNLGAEGYFTAVCYSADEAWDLIEDYLRNIPNMNRQPITPDSTETW